MGCSTVVLTNNGRGYCNIKLKGFGRVTLSVLNLDQTPVTMGQTRFTQRFPDGTMDDRISFFDSADGNITFDHVMEGDFAIRVTATDGRSGRVSGRIDRDGQHLALVVYMEDTGSVSGVVMAPDGATPVDGVELTLLNLNDQRAVAYGSSSSDPANPGSFLFEALKCGDYGLVGFDVPNGRFGQTTFNISDNNLNPEIILQLKGSGTVTGQVMDATGLPVASARVQITAGVDPIGLDPELYRYAKVELNTLTDRSGSFRFDGIPQGPFQLLVHHDELAVSGSASGVVDLPGEVKSVNIVLSASGSARVAVSQYDGSPLPFAVVRIDHSPFSGSGFRQLTLFGVTDSRGETLIEGIPVGYLEMSATDAAGLPAGSADAQLASQGEVVSVSLRAPGRGPVFGSVVQPDGTAVSTGSVSLRSSSYLTRTAIQNSRYRFEGIPFGPFEVTAESNARTVSAEGILGEDPLSGNLDLVLSLCGSVSGELRTASGDIVSGCPVSLQVDNRFISIQSTGPDGTFVFENVPMGQVSLSAIDTVSGETAVGGGLLSADGPTLHVRMVFQPLGTIDGIVRDISGNPPAARVPSYG